MLDSTNITDKVIKLKFLTAGLNREIDVQYTTPSGVFVSSKRIENDRLVSDKAVFDVIKVDLEIYNGGSDLDNGEEAGGQGEIVDDDEDNLARIDLTIEPALNEGKAKLHLTSGSEKIKVWEQNTKVKEVVDLEWDLSQGEQIPQTLWLEAIQKSEEEKDITLELIYEKEGYTQIIDRVKITSVMINLGSAVYRELDWGGIGARGHAALLYKYIGKCVKEELQDAGEYEVVAAMRDHPRELPYTDIIDNGHWSGSYTVPNLDYNKRLKLLKNITELLNFAGRIRYPGGIPMDVLVSHTGGGETWDGTFADIDRLRCDGLVEVIYEYPSNYVGGVWGAITDSVVHYPIQEYLPEHNNQDIASWEYRLNPATQCARENIYRGIRWQTRFEHNDYVTEPRLRN